MKNVPRKDFPTAAPGGFQIGIALLAVAGSAAHLVSKYALANWLPDTTPAVWDIPLLIALALGGVPLVVGLLRAVARGEFGSDLLAGISIVTAVVLGEYSRGGDTRMPRLAPHTERDHATATLPEKLRAVCEHSAIEFFEMGKFLVFGALLASLLQALVPRQMLLGIGQSPVKSVLVMVALAVLLSVCSTVDAFLVLTFAGTFTTGALLAFLVFGPMVDIKSTLMFLTVFQRRAVALMIVLAAQFVLLATIFINLNVA